MKIAIAGFGREGRTNYKYWSLDPNSDITIFDQKPIDDSDFKDAKIVIGPDAFENLYGFDYVMRTPSLAIRKIKTDGKIWSCTNEFFKKCPAKIIGVTGTKGKGTISSMIAEILMAAGKTVHLVGNIGIPALDCLEMIKPGDYVVYELSSFQLWDLEYSPSVAVVGLIEPEHLDIHDDFDDYVKAKSHIRLFQKDDDICFYHPTNRYSENIANVSQKGKIARYGVKDDGAVYVNGNSFCQGDQAICSTDALQLVGQHNIENACAALSVAKYLGVDDENIKNGLVKFRGLEHRLEFVREFKGVLYYNDSFSSSTPATIAAVKSFTQPEILIIGGIDRGGDFANMIKIITSRDNIKAVILFGDIRQKLADLFKQDGYSGRLIVSDAKSMSEIVGQSYNMALPGDVVILSPGCASFDMFKDFVDRGDQFKLAVRQL